jgi:hypothetical protein
MAQPQNGDFSTACEPSLGPRDIKGVSPEKPAQPSSAARPAALATRVRRSNSRARLIMQVFRAIGLFVSAQKTGGALFFNPKR